MKFGVFDHLDADGQPLPAFYESRLSLIEAYDRLGFHAYHVAEHHGTPLGMAPSPSVFLAAVAQRTQRLRFGPMVYALPLYHPVRLIEEIGMLDQMSGGRLELGFGRGASPIEQSFFGQEPATAQDVYAEGVEVVLKGLAAETLSFRGRHFTFDDIPMAVPPLQRPHPPMWYGVHAPESAARAAEKAFNTISLENAGDTRVLTDAYVRAWRAARGDAPTPLIGISYFITVAETADDAMTTARRAYPVWHASFNALFRRRGSAPRHQRPADFDTMAAEGRAVAGTPDQVAAFLKNAATESGVNYLVGQFAFGDLTPAECRRTVELFARHVMPALAG